MAYIELNTSSDFGIRELMNFPNLDSGNLFYPIILFVFFVVFTSITFFREMEREGKAELLSSLAVGGFVTTAIATSLTLLGLISLSTTVTTLVISLIFMTLYMLPNK